LLKRPNKGAVIKDINSVETWANDAVTMSVETGIMGINETGNYEPVSEVTITFIQQVFMYINSIMSGK